MKVLVIEPCYVNYGGYFRSFNICQALSKKGIKVDLLVSSNKNFQLGIKKRKFNNNFTEYQLPRINIHPLLNGRLLRGVIATFFGLIWRDYDIIHACVPTQFEANIPAFLLKLLGKKVVIDWDDYWIGTPIFAGSKWTKKYISFCEKKSPRFFQNIVVVSDFLEEKAKAWGAKNVLKLINGVNASQFPTHTREEGEEFLKLDKNGKYLLAFGNSYANDRAIMLFKTFSAIYKLDPEVKLIFNFDPMSIVRQQGLEDKIDQKCFENIINVGYINQENLGYHLGLSWATILLQGETEDEIACFPIRVGSYLNGESPVIINDVGSEVGNTLKKHGCAIMEKDIEQLAKRTVEFLNNEDMQKEIKNNIQKAKAELSWDNLISGLINFYQEVINK